MYVNIDINGDLDLDVDVGMDMDMNSIECKNKPLAEVVILAQAILV